MAIDASIPLQTRVAPLGNALLSGIQQGQSLRQAYDEKPIRNELLQQQKQRGAQQQFNDEQKSLMVGSAELKQYVDANDVDGARAALLRRQAAAKTLGLPDTHSAEGLQLLESGGIQALKQPVYALYQAGIRAGVLQEPQLQQQSLSGDLQLATAMGLDLRKPEDQQKFQQYKLGMKPSGASDGYHPPVNTSTGVLAWNPETRSYAPMLDKNGNPYLPPSMDPNAAQGVAFGRTTGNKEATNAATFTNLADTWDTNKAFLLESIPQIGQALKEAPGSSISSAVQVGLGKVIGNTKSADAQALVRQYGAMFLQGMPFPPGSQSDAEMRQRASVLSNQLEDASIGVDTKMKLIGNFVQWQDSKANQQRKKADEIKAKQPNNQGATNQPAPAQQQGGPVQIQSDDDYHKLPAGSRFIAPDGSERIKPDGQSSASMPEYEFQNGKIVRIA